MLKISKIENGSIFTLKKDVVKNEVLLSINSTIIVLSELSFNNLTKNDQDILCNLLSLYIQSYDNNSKKSVTTFASCLKFESGLGFRASGSRLRAQSDAKDFILDGNSDCSVVGSDTSCVVDSHVCVTTVTMSCSSSCNWWN